MLVDKKLTGKLLNIEKRYMEMRYEKIQVFPAEMLETYEHFKSEPTDANLAWKQAEPGTKWGDNWLTAWFRLDIQLPEVCNGKKVFIRALTGGETLFLVDGKYKGVFDVNHPAVMMDICGIAGKTYHLAFESYSGHHIPGCGPDENDAPPAPGCKRFDGIELLLEREEVTEFVFDLMVLRQLAEVLGENSLRSNKILKGLSGVFEVVDAIPAESSEESWKKGLAKAKEIMKPLLAMKNSETAPQFGIIGHSHIDTAWLWPISETWRKCARTFSSVLNLIEQYPEFIFVQSTPYQTSIIRERYPEIYERIKEQVKKGSWEPNGAMWVEPDCNIPSGESLVRQLLVGQNATREMFGYTSDTLWLPDVFGYSAALPQILQGANVEFFCTTKISWNDTTRFPYDTFKWKGIDGTAVIAHFHFLQCQPDPKTLTEHWNDIQHKDVQDRRLIAIGYGDGGGGPTAEMIEISRRVGDLEGCPRAKYQSVSEFMKGVRDELTDLPQFSGELYLELHRGTLTSISKVKRGNRKSEIGLRNAEFLWTLAALRGEQYPSAEMLELWKVLLVNQFHDILPGSSIARVNDEAVEDFKKCVEGAARLSDNALNILSGNAKNANKAVLAVNSLSWNRESFVVDTWPEGCYPDVEGAVSQWVEDVEGKQKLVVSGVSLPALGGRVIQLTAAKPEASSPFRFEGNKLETPYAFVSFDSVGRIISLIDKASGREIAKEGAALNTFWMGEDVPSFWDNWDVDRDQRVKMEAQCDLTSREVVADGPVQFRIRSRYKIGENSSLVQDMVFHSDSAQVDFETVVDWHEKHKLLKAGFDLDIFTDSARQEIQYGYVERPTHENLPQDRAKFEVCNHKWSDISEAEFGVAILNDCKYGVSVTGSDVRLSLMKSGVRPDPRGDEGQHVFTYSLLPHACGFSVESVIRPAYELNIPVTATSADENTRDITSLVELDAANIIVESIKWSEDGDGFVLRFYDALKTGRKVNVKFNAPIKAAYETNLLEEKKKELELVDNTAKLYVKPFEIKTLFCRL